MNWYMNYWVNSTKVIDYAVRSIEGQNITLERKGAMPMPIDLMVTYEDGTSEFYTVNTQKKVSHVQIDPKNLMADVDRANNLMMR